MKALDAMEKAFSFQQQYELQMITPYSSQDCLGSLMHFAKSAHNSSVFRT